MHKSGDLMYASEQVLMHSILYVKCPIATRFSNF